MPILFENLQDIEISLRGPKGDTYIMKPNEKKVMPNFLLRYSPDKIRPIRNEPPKDYIELISRPYKPISGQYFLDINKEELMLYDGEQWRVVAKPNEGKNWRWLGDEDEAPEEELPTIGKLGQRKLNI